VAPSGAADLQCAATVSRCIETVDLEPEEGHDLLKMLVVPRPIAWITTLREDGVVNLAPFACYTMLGFGPMMLGVGFGRVRGVHKKDTLRNIERTRELVIHTVTEDLVDQVVSTARSAPAGESKAHSAGLTLVDASAVEVPRIAECAAALECCCEDILRIGTGHDLVIARVVAVHLDDACFPNGEPDYTRYRPVGRLHAEMFSTLGEVFHRARPLDGTHAG
jgi:flavin reductase (DIM6/NTAB) family NADH-FMN oxidoreductase RutF